MASKIVHIDLDKRWRPKDRRGPVCGYKFRTNICAKRGAHYCEPRADHVVMFFASHLQHTRGVHVRKPFILEGWQEWEVIRPLFGEVLYSQEHHRYVRRYRIGHIVVARKNGKSELAAGIQLYMLISDDEEAAEVYSAAKDTKQAGKVFDPAARMIQLNGKLSDHVKLFRNARRLVVERTASIYEVLTADAAGELGHNPHAFNLDEVLAQPNGTLWEAMTTAVGARAQELLYTTTTETNDSASFGASMIEEAERIQEDPTRAPHVFAFVRKLPSTREGLERLYRLFPGHPDLPVSTDPFDERNWKWPNPALDGFKSREAMRRQAIDAHENAEKENGFRQFQVNQRVQQVTRYIQMDLWDENTGDLLMTPDWNWETYAGQRSWAGLDLSSKLDMTAWCLQFEDGRIRWRFWIPESVVPTLSEHTDGQFEQWCRDGWVVATDGDTIDYDQVMADIAIDCERFNIVRCVYDRWSGEPIRQRLSGETGLDMIESGTTYTQMTAPMNEAMRLLKARKVQHGGNPVARWMADNVEAKRPADDPDRVRPVKPDRQATGKRIDGMPAWFFALDGWLMSKPEAVSAYEDPQTRIWG
jgi:phage terminase large subunit-like protein